MKRIYNIFILIIILLALSACEKDESNSTFSKKYYVYCYFYVPSYTQLFNAMGNYGQFVQIRRTTNKSTGVTVVQMKSQLGTDDYTIDATMQYFEYGLGGLIVGSNYYGEPLAYDLSCPNCDRADRRLTLNDDGTVKCAKCSIVYDLNNYGFINSKPEDCIHTSPRGLYRYKINYVTGGEYLNVYN